MDNKWDFNCPQYVDFNHIDELDQGDTEAFFENCKINSTDDVESPEVMNKRLQPFQCSVEYKSTNAAATQTSCLSATRKEDGKGKKTPPVAAKSAAEGRKILTARRSSKGLPQLSNTRKVFERKEQKILVTKPTEAATKGQKRNISFAGASDPKKTRPATSPAIRLKCKTTKRTYPTTPRCLQRSKNKKTLKSSEEIELEKIAEMRKQVDRQIRTNRVMMKRIIHPPALKPLPRETLTEDCARVNQCKKAPVELKKGVPLVFGNTFPAVPFSFRAPKLLQNEAGPSLVKSPGLHRCSTPYSTKRRSINRAVGRKAPVAGKHSIKTTAVPVKNKKLPEASNKCVPVGLQKKPDRPSSRQTQVLKQDTGKMLGKNSKSNASSKVAENKPSTKNKDVIPSANLRAGKVPFKDVSNKLPWRSTSSIKALCKNQGTSLSFRSASTLSGKPQISNDIQGPPPRLAHSLVQRSQIYSGLPFLRKQKSDLMILPADSSVTDKSNLENVTPSTPRRSARINKDNKIQGEEKQVKVGTGNKPKGKRTMSSASNADNSIQFKAKKKAEDWRRKIEGELELQKKSLLKSSKPRILRSASTLKPLAFGTR